MRATNKTLSSNPMTKNVYEALKRILDITMYIYEDGIEAGDKKVLADIAKVRGWMEETEKVIDDECMKNLHAVALGKKGGEIKSEKKAAAARENAKKCGRPRTTEHPAS